MSLDVMLFHEMTLDVMLCHEMSFYVKRCHEVSYNSRDMMGREEGGKAWKSQFVHRTITRKADR